MTPAPRRRDARAGYVSPIRCSFLFHIGLTMANHQQCTCARCSVDGGKHIRVACFDLFVYEILSGEKVTLSQIRPSLPQVVNMVIRTVNLPQTGWSPDQQGLAYHDRRAVHGPICTSASSSTYIMIHPSETDSVDIATSRSPSVQ